jgi:cell division protein FtsQ
MTPLPAPLDVKLMNLTASLLLAVFVLLALTAAAGWAMAHPLFAIRGVTVTGDVSHNNALTLRANVAPQLRGTFLTINLAAARQAFETMPWVRRAVVRREFPNRLKVILQEHQAVGYWGDDGDSTLVNTQGEVFEANVGEVEQDDLPRLSGPQGQSAQVLAMYRALQPLFGHVELSIDELSLTGHGSWHAKLDTGAGIELGRGTEDEVVGRTERFLGTLTQVASRYGRTVAVLESADLRYQAGYAVRLRGVSTVLPEAQKAPKQ